MSDICPVTNTDRLLLSTDGSEFSEGAIREAIKLAKRCGSKLAMMSVVETNAEYAAIAPQLVEKEAKNAKEHLVSAAARAKAEGVEAETVIRESEDIYAAVAEEAQKRESTMIVVGRRGRKGLTRLVMGSTTARVIGHAPCSVLVVPRAAQVGFGSIVTATDGSKYSAAAASEAIGIAKRNNSRLTIVAVVPADIAMPTDLDFAALQQQKLADQEMEAAERNARAVRDAAQEEGVEARAFVMTGKPADAIIETARDAKADLIVVGSHGRTGLDKLLMGSVAERVIVLAPGAVLVVKARTA